jgi:hypothetical protein
MSMVDLKPQNEAEHAVNDTMSVLVNSKNAPAISLADFLAICQSAPDYSRRIITHCRTPLTHVGGPHGVQIANMIRMAEWKLEGTSEYIEYHHLLPEEQRFIYDRLENQPDDFSSDDLHALLRHTNNKAEHPLRLAVLAELERRSLAFAKRQGESSKR